MFQCFGLHVIYLLLALRFTGEGNPNNLKFGLEVNKVRKIVSPITKNRTQVLMNNLSFVGAY